MACESLEEGSLRVDSIFQCGFVFGASIGGGSNSYVWHNNSLGPACMEEEIAFNTQLYYIYICSERP